MEKDIHQYDAEIAELAQREIAVLWMRDRVLGELGDIRQTLDDLRRLREYRFREDLNRLRQESREAPYVPIEGEFDFSHDYAEDD